MESGTIVRWLKSEGEPVEKGEPLFELDTDKVTQEVEAEAAGVLLKIAVAEGEVPVGQTVAFIGSEGEDVPETAAAAAPQEEAPKEAKPSQSEPTPAQETPQEAAIASGNGRIKASPVPTGEVERIALSNVRKTIARRLTEAWQIPVFQLQASADMTRVNSLVARF